MILAILFTVAALFTWLAVNRSEHSGHEGALQLLVLLNMVMITLFGGALFSVAGFESNCGNVWYANVMLAQFLIMRRFGWKSGLHSVAKTFGALVMLVVTIEVVQMASGDSSELSRAYSHVIEVAQLFALASFVAFWLGQGALIMLYRRWQDRSLILSYGVAIVIAQTVDSIVFFPIAFEPSKQMVEILFVGLALKIVMGLIALPVLMMREHLHKRRGS